jgi:RNA exonuclease 4
MLKNRIIIGHSLENDFLVLNYEHPKKQTRDTSKFKFFQNNINLPQSLKFLTKQYFDINIQETHHDSVLKD